MKILWIALAILASLTPGLRAQVVTGYPPFGSFASNGFDSVDNANLNVHFAIPVVNKAGRGLPFYYVLNYDSSIWQRLGSNWSPLNQHDLGMDGYH